MLKFYFYVIFSAKIDSDKMAEDEEEEQEEISEVNFKLLEKYINKSN